jgi:sulfofructose kinase
MMSKRWDILGIGVVAVDDLLYVDHYPQADEKIRVTRKQRQGGGLTGTALVAAARQGARTAYCGRLGQDDLSQFSLQELEREGVDTSLTPRDRGGSPCHSIIIIDILTGARTILFSMEEMVEPDPATITEAMVAGCKVLFIDQYAYAAGIRAAGLAHDCGIPVVADMESLNLPDPAAFIAQIDHLIIGIDFARTLSGESENEKIVQTLYRPGMAACVVTAGALGCWYTQNGGEVIHFPAFQVEAVDTTGCGDVFHGAYAAALARGESIDRAVLVGTAAAGLKATQPGGRAGIPDLARTQSFLEDK